MPKTLLAGKDSKQLSVMLTRRCSNNLETWEGSEDRLWNWKKCDKPLKHKMISNMKVPSPSVIDCICFSMVEGDKQPQCPVPYMRVVRVHVDDALNLSIKSENIITSQFDVTTETTVNESASSLCFFTGKNPIVKSCSWERMYPLIVLFFCQCLKTERGSGWLTQNKNWNPQKHKQVQLFRPETGDDIEENCKIVAADQFIEVLYKNDMKEFYENEQVDQCNVTVNIYGAKLQYNEKATTRANTGLNDRATAQATTVHVKTTSGRTLTINCSTGQEIEKIKDEVEKTKKIPKAHQCLESQGKTQKRQKDNCGQQH